ncbi:YqiA/YcfP family alpha/beta fold hydrolase [Pedobacter aquatilis]|uniref:alpha/beta hydrolase n=1 Tax=Pedobacter aquatilis TaxID=351343 RepID=UPI0025B5E04C|nr:alpha/beta fold hydrolase [Pedobacter aquatilis]MDN3585820.1 YqiA/YcfP family alpha/beta fold hydrolase [Pedobacter aquatilis]
MKKRYKVLLGLSAILVAGYLMGPKPKKPLYNAEPINVPDLKDLDNYVKTIEGKHKIKPGNEAEIVWADSSHMQTEYAIVYLHGFSASKTEGNPVHLNLAKKLKANLYLSRLADHGVDTIAPLQHFTADGLWNTSKQAFAIGKKLGKKVILIGTSTGGTVALKLAATYPEINSLILLSPNVAINDRNAWMLNDPWGLQIARKVLGSDERTVDGRTLEYKKYWYTNYRIESLVQLQEFVETTMLKSVFEKVKQPVLMVYYYKNELEQDPVVRVDAMIKMYDELGTSPALKRKVAIPNANNHVLGSYLTSKDLPSVESAIDGFVETVLKVPTH